MHVSAPFAENPLQHCIDQTPHCYDGTGDLKVTAGIELADAGQLGELVLQRHQVAGANRVDVLGVVGDQVYVRVDLAVDGLPGGPPA